MRTKLRHCGTIESERVSFSRAWRKREEAHDREREKGTKGGGAEVERERDSDVATDVHAFNLVGKCAQIEWQKLSIDTHFPAWLCHCHFRPSDACVQCEQQSMWTSGSRQRALNKYSFPFLFVAQKHLSIYPLCAVIFARSMCVCVWVRTRASECVLLFFLLSVFKLRTIKATAT